MNKNSTLKDNKLIVKKEPEPSQKTLDFLKMFARAYYADKKAKSPLSGIILN